MNLPKLPSLDSLPSEGSSFTSFITYSKTYDNLLEDSLPKGSRMENVVLSSEGDEAFVELASTPKQKVFKKQILRANESFTNPSDRSKRVTVTPEFGKKLVDNFKAGRALVTFPMVDENNRHVQSPERNLGEVVDLTYDDKDGVTAYISVNKNADDIGKTILGASAMLSLDHTDIYSGNKIGPTLIHVAATNNPALPLLRGFEPVSLSAVEDNDNIDSTYIVMLSEGESSSDSESETDEGVSAMAKLEDLLRALKEDFDIDVEELQKAHKKESESDTDKVDADKSEDKASDKKADDKEDESKAKKDEEEDKSEEEVKASDTSDLDELVAKLSDVLKAADPDLVSLSNSEVTISDLANGVIELSNNYKALEDTVGSLNRKSAEADVDAAVREGKVLPAQRDAYVELKLSNEDMYNSLIPESAIVAMSAEQGVSVHDAGNNGAAVSEVDSEIARITAKLKK